MFISIAHTLSLSQATVASLDIFDELRRYPFLSLSFFFSVQKIGALLLHTRKKQQIKTLKTFCKQPNEIVPQIEKQSNNVPKGP